jgi:anti-anti-sigma regulatory factor
MTHRTPCLPITASTGYGRVALYRLAHRSVVIFTGEIDAAFRSEPFDEIVEAIRGAGQPVYVDCSAVTFFGAEGLRLLDRLVDAAVQHRLAAVVTSPAVQAVARVYPMETYTHAA